MKQYIDTAIIYISIRLKWMFSEVWSAFWDFPLWMRPHSILSLFYTLLTPSLMYLEFDGEFGLSQLENNTNLSWSLWIAIFSLTAWIVSYSKKHYVYVLSFAPVLIYIVNISVSINEVSVLGILPIVYLGSFVLMGISSIRLMFGNRELIKRAIELERKTIEAKSDYEVALTEVLRFKDKYRELESNIATLKSKLNDKADDNGL